MAKKQELEISITAEGEVSINVIEAIAKNIKETLENPQYHKLIQSGG